MSIKLIAVLLAVSSVAADAHAVSCPAAADGKRLSSVTVFDGPPIENASLVPDSTHRRNGVDSATWRIAGIYKNGRLPYLSCEYGSTKTIVLPVRHAKACTYTAHRKLKSLSCQ